MAFGSIKMQYKLIVEFIVIMWALNEWCLVRGHQMERLHGNNHHCDHRHPKAHEVNDFFFYFHYYTLRMCGWSTEAKQMILIYIHFG